MKSSDVGKLLYIYPGHSVFISGIYVIVGETKNYYTLDRNYVSLQVSLKCQKRIFRNNTSSKKDAGRFLHIHQRKLRGGWVNGTCLIVD